MDQGTILSQFESFYVPAATKQLREMHCLYDDMPPLSDSDSDLEDDESDDIDGEDHVTEGRVPSRSNAASGGPVSYQRFCELWKVVFPDLANRRYRSIMGKCKWCGLIDIGRKKCMDAVSQSHYSFFFCCNICFNLILLRMITILGNHETLYICTFTSSMWIHAGA